MRAGGRPRLRMTVCVCAMSCDMRCAAQRYAARTGLSEKFKTLGAIVRRESQT